MIGWEASRTVTANGTRVPWLPAGPGVGSETSLPSWKYQNGPAFSVRSRQAPMPIISLNAGHPANALSAACTTTSPPPLLMYCSKAVFRAAGQRSSGAS